MGKHVSRVLYAERYRPASQPSIWIWHCCAYSSDLPTSWDAHVRAARPPAPRRKRSTWSCTTWASTHRTVANSGGRLLPHLLTLTCKLVAGGYFLLDALALTDFSLLGSRLPSSARTFLRCYWHPRLRIYPCLRSHGKSSDFLIAKCNPSEPLRILH